MGLKELLPDRWIQHRTQERRGSRCPDETVLAAYAEGIQAGRLALESHLAECLSCRKQVAFLAQEDASASTNDVPQWLLARARELVPERSSSAKPLWWAAAATVTACLVFAFTLPMRELTLPLSFRAPGVPAMQESSASKPRRDTARAPELRARTRPSRSPDLVRPSEGATVSGDGVEFRWRPMRESLFYEVQLTSLDGELIWKERTGTTHVRLPNSVSLRPGERYFVWVVAHMREGNAVKARAVSFKVSTFSD